VVSAEVKIQICIKNLGDRFEGSYRFDGGPWIGCQSSSPSRRIVVLWTVRDALHYKIVFPPATIHIEEVECPID
jgi:hypothetical protein